MKSFGTFLIFFMMSIMSSDATSCQERCENLIRDVLTKEICREARKLYPRPRVGNACSDGMEAGFYDVCMPTCMGKESENRIWYACKKASDELPKPTMARWCEHGYREGYRAASIKLEGVFSAADGTDGGDL